MPTTEQLQREVDRVHYRRDFSRVMVSTIYSLVVVAAVAVLVAVLLLPILRIYGHSMNDTLDEATSLPCTITTRSLLSGS